MPLMTMTTEEVLRYGGGAGVWDARLGLPTDAIVPGAQNGRGTMAGHLRFLEEIKRDITPEQWARMEAASKAADREECCVDEHDGERAAAARRGARMGGQGALPCR